ncbi:MAG: NAD(P)H-hydrate dehydratase [Acidiferrobacterales bacterium]
MSLPEALYYAAQTRQLDKIAIEDRDIPGYTLMQRAGQATFTLLRSRWPRARRISVVCGPGNNGGDGYVVARLAHEASLEPLVMALGDGARLRGDALQARKDLEAAGLQAVPFSARRLEGSDVIVDALFGTGLEREIRDDWRAAIEAMNAQAHVPRLAVDIPSGLHADAGRVLGIAVRADATITFIGLKTGLFTGHGPDYCGEVVFDGLGTPAGIYNGVTPAALRITQRSLVGLLTHRRRSLHKGDAGHVVVIGGAEGMSGAARLAGEAAYRTGAGLVTLATHPAHAATISGTRPELLTHAVHDGRALRAVLKRATVIAAGPGLGQGEWGRLVLAVALESTVPKVVDADALNILAADPVRRDDWVLTPHPGEAARLLGMTTSDIQAHRFDAVRALTEGFGGVCVLKGAGTLVAHSADHRVWLCDAGNPGMASGGMGDVLTGLIAALLAQRLQPLDAARLGVWLHATAGDDAAAQGGEIGVMASDLLPFMRRRLNQLTQHEA